MKMNLKIAIRKLRKHKSYSIINVIGLSLSISVFLAIIFYVKHERSFDKFYDNYKNIYRVSYKTFQANELESNRANTLVQVADVAKEAFPEIHQSVRFRHFGSQVVSPASDFEQKSFEEDKIYHTSSSFFKIFSIPILHGNRETCLNDTYSAVISKSTAEKYFDDNPIGKSIKIYGDNPDGTDYKITGVFQDIPENSHLDMDILLSLSSFYQDHSNWGWLGWNWYGFYTYIEINPETNPVDIENKLDEYLSGIINKISSTSNRSTEFNLQPLSDIHLTSHLSNEIKANGNDQLVNILIIVAICLMAIGWINYLNMSTTQLIERAKETGLRRTFGADKSSLIYQFLSETLIITLISIIAAMVLLGTLSDPLNTYLDLNIVVDFKDIGFWLTTCLTLIGTGLLIGLYPAMMLTAYKPIEVLKGNFKKNKKGARIRKILVVTQYSAAILILISTWVIFEQVSFLQNRDLGISLDQKLVIQGPKIKSSNYYNNIHYLSTDFLSSADILNFTMTTNPPGTSLGTEIFRRKGAAEDLIMNAIYIGDDHAKVFGLKILSGRDFDKERSADQRGVILNESAANLFGFTAQNALGEVILCRGSMEIEIIGVVGNYNQMAFEESFEPMVYLPREHWESSWMSDYFVLSINSNNLTQSIDRIEAQFMSVFPGNPFDYFFLDDTFNQQYNSEIRFSKIFTLFTVFVIIIANIGFLTLASYTISQAGKEISLRKVLGASVRTIINRMSYSFMKWVMLGALISIPIAYLVTNYWLEQFPHRVELNVWMFSIPVVAVCSLSLLTILYHIVKAAHTNPTVLLREE